MGIYKSKQESIKKERKHALDISISIYPSIYHFWPVCIEEELSEDGAVEMKDRRAKLNVDVPYLLKKLMGVEFLLFRQRNTKVK